MYLDVSTGFPQPAVMVSAGFLQTAIEVSCWPAAAHRGGA